MANEDIARAILDTGSYVVLATADADGVPWASPVWFAMEENPELYWVSHPGARHSQNIAVRPGIAMVVLDSTVAPAPGRRSTPRPRSSSPIPARSSTGSACSRAVRAQGRRGADPDHSA